MVKVLLGCLIVTLVIPPFWGKAADYLSPPESTIVNNYYGETTVQQSDNRSFQASEARKLGAVLEIEGICDPSDPVAQLCNVNINEIQVNGTTTLDGLEYATSGTSVIEDSGLFQILEISLETSAYATHAGGAALIRNILNEPLIIGPITLDTFATGGMAVPTSTFSLNFDMASSTPASTTVPKDDKYVASSTGNMVSFSISTGTEDIWNTVDDGGYGYATSLKEGYTIMITPSTTDGVADTSQDERNLCGGDTGGCNDATNTPVFFGRVKIPVMRAN